MPADTDYSHLRQVVHPELARLPAEQLEAALGQYDIDAESMESLFGDIGHAFSKVASTVGQVAVQAAPTLLPIAGTALGTAFGGPLGAALGGSLGRLAGGAIGGRPGRGGQGMPPGVSGGPAAGQLLQTIMRPETLKALGSMALGQLGRPNVSVGGAQVPVGAFTNLLGVLANQAASEYNSTQSEFNESLPEYLRDYTSEPVADPAVAQQRAGVLLIKLQDAAYEREAAENGGESAEFSEEESEMESVAETSEYYDALELADLAGEAEDY